MQTGMTKDFQASQGIKKKILEMTCFNRNNICFFFKELSLEVWGKNTPDIWRNILTGTMFECLWTFKHGHSEQNSRNGNYSFY